MATHIHIFMNNPTAGAVDGTEISSGDDTLPLTFLLDASESESQAAKCAVRCDSGYLISGNLSVYFEGTTSAKWKVAADNNFSSPADALESANWQDSIDLAEVDATNKIFWVKAASSTDENPQNDKSVKIKAEGYVIAED